MKHSKFKRIKKAVVTLFLTTNLTLVGTGSAVLNTASDSANLDDQATPSASNYRNSTVFSPLPSPQEQLNQPNTEVNKATRTYKIDPTGGFIEDELIVKFKNDYLNNEVALPFELMDFLGEWWTGHILGLDRKYVECFREHGLR